MNLLLLFLCSVLFTYRDVKCLDKVPDDFLFGLATSAYQVEGAWNECGKGVSIWDTLTHTKNVTYNGDTGDIACDSYNQYKTDVKMLKEVGAQVYRFSIAWTRILPYGFANKTNKEGIKYYQNLIDELLENGIEPMVTLYHWDLPQTLQDIGGWPNPLMEDYFADYARICFEHFGDKVKLWTTFNEPMQICYRSYGSSSFHLAPDISSPGIADYLCAHTLIKAHAKVYHLYKKEFRKQKGKISIVLDFTWAVPKTNSHEDQEAADRYKKFYLGWYLNPIVYGDYPKVMIEYIDRKSKEQNFPQSRLPKFTAAEKIQNRRTYDYIGINIYITVLAANKKQSQINFEMDMDVETSVSNDWKTPTPDSIFTITPWAARACLKWVKDEYNNPEIVVTENGIFDINGTMDDDFRKEYIQSYVGSILDAKEMDKVNVVGYIYWSLMDNFEWNNGYRDKFGLYHVDFNSANRTRTPKKSAKYFKHITSTRCLADRC